MMYRRHINDYQTRPDQGKKRITPGSKGCRKGEEQVKSTTLCVYCTRSYNQTIAADLSRLAQDAHE